MDRLFVGAGVAIGAVVPGVLALVPHRYVRRFAARMSMLVGLAVVVTVGAAVATLC